MAYSSTVTRTRKGNRVHVQIVESEAVAASEVTITNLPRWGRIVRQTCALQGTGGDEGSTVDPVIGTVTNPAASTESVRLQNDIAAAAVNNVPETPFTYYASDGTLYHRSVVNSGTDSDITSEYEILVGWGR